MARISVTGNRRFHRPPSPYRGYQKALRGLESALGPVGEDYKTIKSRIELENFSGKSVLSVYQDFHAKVLMKNIVSLFVLPVNEMLAADTTSERKYDHQVNFTHALAAGKDLMPLLFQRSIRKIRSTLDALLLLLIKIVELIRPGQKYPRKHWASNRKYFMCYKPIA